MRARWWAEGATLIDIGGESTRPGAPDVSEQEELDRVIPVVERMVAELEVMISLDTSKAAVMRGGLRGGCPSYQRRTSPARARRWLRLPLPMFRCA